MGAIAPTTIARVVVITMVADGTIEGFNPSVQTAIINAFAVELSVDVSAVILSVSSASVLIQIEIQLLTAATNR